MSGHGCAAEDSVGELVVDRPLRVAFYRAGVDDQPYAWSFRGILASPLGFQEGAKKVADEGIHGVITDVDSTHTDYVLKFLNHTLRVYRSL